MPRYEFVDGSSSKFWEITLDGSSFTTTYGRIGTDGQTSMKGFDSAEQAKREYEKLIAEKVKKGYRLIETPSLESPADAEEPDAVAGFAAETLPSLKAAPPSSPLRSSPFYDEGEDEDDEPAPLRPAAIPLATPALGVAAVSPRSKITVSVVPSTSAGRSSVKAGTAGKPSTKTTPSSAGNPAATLGKAAKAPAVPASPDPVGTRYFEFVDGSSSKFWEITLDGTSFTTRYGRIGAEGQMSLKEYDSEERARKEYEKLVAEKLRKGYLEK